MGDSVGHFRRWQRSVRLATGAFTVTSSDVTARLTAWFVHRQSAAVGRPDKTWPIRGAFMFASPRINSNAWAR
jgi:hypothetical protein